MHTLPPLEISTLYTGSYAELNVITGNSDQKSTTSIFEQASKRFGPVNILIVNATITGEGIEYPIWNMSLDTWEECLANVRGAFLTIKQFLRTAGAFQELHGRELENLSIVVAGKKQMEHT